MNHAIASLIRGKLEQDAIEDLKRFNCNWRVRMRDGEEVANLTPDHNDKRYNLIINDGIVVHVLAG